MLKSTTFSSKKEIIVSSNKVTVAMSFGDEHDINVDLHEDSRGGRNSEGNFGFVSAANLTFMTRMNRVGNILVHLRPIEAISDSLEYSEYSTMAKIFMGLTENLHVEFGIKDDFGWRMRALMFE